MLIQTIALSVYGVQYGMTLTYVLIMLHLIAVTST